MSYTINHVVLVGGNLTRDAELRYTNSGSLVVSFSIALNRRVKQGETWEEKTDFFRVSYWGKPAEAIGKFLTKGKKVAVEGRLSQNRWQGQDGKNNSSVEIVASNVVLMGGPQGGAQDQGGDGPHYPDQEPEYYPDQDYQPGNYQIPPPFQGGPAYQGNPPAQGAPPNQYQNPGYGNPPGQQGGFGGGYPQGPDTSGKFRDGDIPF